MKLFCLSILLVLSVSSDFKDISKFDKIAKKEAKYHCQCLGKLKREVNKQEKKAKKLEKERSKNYKSGDKLFGGYTLDFNLEGCIKEKRNKKENKFVESLSDRDKKRYQSKVKDWVKRKCPKKMNGTYYQ